MDGGFPFPAVVGTAQRFAIKRNDLGIKAGGSLHPGKEALLKLLRVKRSEDAAERVMRGDTVRQRQEGAEPRKLGVAELLDLDPAIGTTDNSTDRNHHDIEQVVVFGALHTRIVARGKVVAQASGRRVLHRTPPQIIVA